MKSLKRFEDFLKEGIVRRVRINKERSKSSVVQAERRMNSLKSRLEKLGINDENANDYVEYCYDIIATLVRARLYLDGYSIGGIGAHEAEVSYLRVLGFPENDVQFVDQMRFFRNGILYYGTALDAEYAEKVIEFTKQIYPKLRELIK